VVAVNGNHVQVHQQFSDHGRFRQLDFPQEVHFVAANQHRGNNRVSEGRVIRDDDVWRFEIQLLPAPCSA